MTEILHVVGARPNFMKMAPVHRALAFRSGIRSHILHTGQHYDRLMSDVFFEDLRLPAPDVSLGVGSGSHAEQTAGIMVAFERYIASEPPDVVVVYGDVNSTVAAALVCAKQRVLLAHVEAGLRSRDLGMPEEINRIVTDRLADLLLVTEPSGRHNLRAEGVPESRIRDTGNAMIDSLVELLAREGITERRVRPGRPLVLVTIHRPTNVDNPQRLSALVALLRALAEEADVVFPVHPRTRKQLEISDAGVALGSAVVMIEPLRYREFVRQMTEAALIVTDSGGIQEESAFLGIPCLTLRANTERPISLDAGTNRLEPDCGGDLLGAARELMGRRFPAIGRNPILLAAGWDGHAGQRIADAIVEMVRS